MYTKLHTYQPDRKLSSWVLSIASHYCIDRLRRRWPVAVTRRGTRRPPPCPAKITARGPGVAGRVA